MMPQLEPISWLQPLPFNSHIPDLASGCNNIAIGVLGDCYRAEAAANLYLYRLLAAEFEGPDNSLVASGFVYPERLKATQHTQIPRVSLWASK